MFTRPRDRRQRILEFIQSHVERYGYPPSIREIGTAVGINSTRAVKYHLDILVREGRLERAAGRPRSLSTSARPAALPLIGRIAAGSPVLAIENVESYVSLSRFRECFLLRVQGESMRDAGVMDGDLVVVDQRAEPHAGDIVAARIGDEATVKHFRRRDGQIILEPANPDFQPVPIEPDRDDFQVIGVVVGLLRNYH